MQKRIATLLILLTVSITFESFAAQQNILKIYLDADKTNHSESALSIEMGIKTAFSQINNTIQGHKIVFVNKDHKGNSLRSKMHMDEFKNDPQALLMMAGMHSPPLIKYREFINKNEILTLVPWAAGGPITRHPNSKNWIFRLSIDDTKAGIRMVDFAINNMQCKHPHLLLEKTAWGKSNYITMDKAIHDISGKNAHVTWFNWNTKEHAAKIALQQIITHNTDCVLFVGNAIEGAEFAKAISKLEKKIKMISHWGITGGTFHHTVAHPIRTEVDLHFIQSCFSFISSEKTDFSDKVFAKLQSLYPDIKSKKELLSPTGFIHAYDLGLLTIEALNQITLSEDITIIRANLKNALENLNTPIQGLVKTYNKPFSAYHTNNKDAHEALGLEDFCMAKYGSENEIIVIENQ